MPDQKGRLTGQEKIFVERYAATDDATYAAEKAGYAFPMHKGAHKAADQRIQAAVAVERRRKAHKIAAICYDRSERECSDPRTPYKLILETIKTIRPDLVEDGAQAKDDHEKTFHELLREAEKRWHDLKTIDGEIVDEEPVELDQGVFG